MADTGKIDLCPTLSRGKLQTEKRLLQYGDLCDVLDFPGVFLF